MATVYERCEGGCTPAADVGDVSRIHGFPEAGTRVVVSRSVLTRALGDEDGDGTEVKVEAGAEGEVRGFVAVWHDVHVQLTDGRDVWVGPDFLEWDVEVVIGWTKSDPDTGYSSFADGYRPGADQHRLMVRVAVPADADVMATVEALAESAFLATNHPAPETLSGFAAQIYAGIVASGYRGAEGGHYSLSVGDTVSVAEVMLECAAVGWRRIR